MTGGIAQACGAPPKRPAVKLPKDPAPEKKAEDTKGG